MRRAYGRVASQKCVLHSMPLVVTENCAPFELSFAADIMRNTPNYFYGPNADTIGRSGWAG